MKTLLFMFAMGFVMSMSAARAQEQPSCCSTSAKDFAALGDDPAFIAAHLAPLPFQKDPGPGKMISFKTKDGKTAHAFEVKAPSPSSKVLFVFHEYWGLNDYIKREAEKLQAELGDVNVLALDLYDGKVATDPKVAVSYMQAVKEDRARAIIAGAISHVGKKAKIGTIGWCYGGGWSLQASLMARKQAQACVMYYGMPEKNVEILKTLNTDVLGIFGKKDQWITPAVVDQFEKSMKEAGKHLEVKSYDADHAFANPSNPKFDKDATEDAHAAAMNFLKKHFEEANG
jgi:carboxymethylenebutenolidase